MAPLIARAVAKRDGLVLGQEPARCEAQSRDRSAHALGRPGDDVEVVGVLQQRRRWWQVEAVAAGQVVVREVGAGVLERPRLVVDVAAPGA
jgi:hypothetical protein